MNPKLFYWYYDRTSEYKFRFDGGYITVEAKNEAEARILAQAEAIQNGWNYEILPNIMEMDELKKLIDDHVVEIYREYQERLGKYNDLEPCEEMALQAIQDTLAAFIVKTCE